MFVKVEERIEARRLRAEEGLSMKAIAARVGVSVGSVSLWTRDIELTPAQVAHLAESNHRLGGQRRGQEERARKARLDRLTAQDHGRALARSGDPAYLAGCMLYWGEGCKGRNAVAFVNCDVAMHRCFLAFLRRSYGVTPEQVRLSINCHLNNGLTLHEIERWWLHQLALPQDSLRTSAVNRASRASRFRRNTLVYGTARVTVHSTFVVQSIYGAIQEYAGTDRPEWLEGYAR